MTDRAPNIAEIIQRLPQKLQVRFNSLGNYVQGMIDEESAKYGKEVRLRTEDIQLIQLAALVYSLDSFLRAGTHSARSASVAFEEFGLEGFQVGSSLFTRSNENTLRGEVLAERLEATITRTRLGRTIKNSPTMRELISTLIREMNDGTALG
jgi:hypothetical protein